MSQSESLPPENPQDPSAAAPGPQAYESGAPQPTPGYGYDSNGQQAGGPGPSPSFGPPPSEGQHAGQQHFGAAPSSGSGPSAAYAGGPQHGQPISGAAFPPPGLKGIYEGPLHGAPASASDQKLWSVLSHLSVIAGWVLGAGLLGWVGPLVIYLIYKDRDRYLRYNAAEALNAAIASLIASVVLGIVLVVIAIITFGIGALLAPLAYLPLLLHLIFAIVGAVKCNSLEWWNYPVNLRLVK